MAASVTEWVQLGRQGHSNGVPLPDSVQWQGVSKVARADFWTLRVLWPNFHNERSHLTERELHDFGLLAYHDRAKQWLKAFPPFRMYLTHVESNEKTKPWSIGQSDDQANGLGIMEIPRHNQEVVLSAAQKNRLHSISEEVILSSLMSFLQAITMRNPDIKCDWSTQKKYFKASFSRKSKLRVKVDGWLVNRDTGHVKALVEAKKEKRGQNEPYVSRQESAEVCAFLSSHSPTPRSPIYLISQDGDEIYLTVATFGQRYIDFIQGQRKHRPDEDFLKMHKFGPWSIGNRGDVNAFARIALAIAIQSSQ